MSNPQAAEFARLSDVEPERLQWVWPGRFPAGKLSLLCGDPSLGKSLITTDMAARVSSGTPWPDARGAPNPAGSVIILTAEDDLGDTVVPRLMAAGADLTRVLALQAVVGADGTRRGFSLADVPILERALDELPDVRLLIIDPISAYLAGTDSHKNAEVRSLLAPLAAMAQRFGVAVVAVQHLTKSCAGKAMYRAMGSLAFIAAARAAWAVVADPADPRHRGLLPVKMNLGAELRGLGYRIETAVARPDLDPQPVIAWDSAPLDDATADGWLAAEAEAAAGKPGPEAEALQAAAHWLTNALAAGPRLADELFDEAEGGEEISKGTLKRAKKAAGVESFRPEIPGPWWWRLKGAQHDESASTHKIPAPLAPLAKLTQKRGFLTPSEPLNSKGRKLFDAKEATHHGDNGDGMDDDGRPPQEPDIDADALAAEWGEA